MNAIARYRRLTVKSRRRTTNFMKSWQNTKPDWNQNGENAKRKGIDGDEMVLYRTSINFTLLPLPIEAYTAALRPEKQLESESKIEMTKRIDIDLTIATAMDHLHSEENTITKPARRRKRSCYNCQMNSS